MFHLCATSPSSFFSCSLFLPFQLLLWDLENSCLLTSVHLSLSQLLSVLWKLTCSRSLLFTKSCLSILSFIFTSYLLKKDKRFGRAFCLEKVLHKNLILMIDESKLTYGKLVVVFNVTHSTLGIKCSWAYQISVDKL